MLVLGLESPPEVLEPSLSHVHPKIEPLMLYNPPRFLMVFDDSELAHPNWSGNCTFSGLIGPHHARDCPRSQWSHPPESLQRPNWWLGCPGRRPTQLAPHGCVHRGGVNPRWRLRQWPATRQRRGGCFEVVPHWSADAGLKDYSHRNKDLVASCLKKNRQVRTRSFRFIKYVFFESNTRETTINSCYYQQPLKITVVICSYRKWLEINQLKKSQK